MAQRFPTDFDGIVRFVPVINWTGLQFLPRKKLRQPAAGKDFRPTIFAAEFAAASERPLNADNNSI
jgi:hypothetical protein